jgi:hypothetical protein
MKAPSEQHWENTLTRYFAAWGIPLRWDYGKRRYRGISGHLFARLNPRVEENVWVRMPEYLKKYEHQDRNPDGRQVVIFTTNKIYGDSVDDSIVVMRLGTFIPMMKSLLETDKERWTE